MSISGILYRLSWPNPKIEFSVILSWTLFYPKQDTKGYFLIFALLVLFFLTRNVFSTKNVSLCGFSYFLMTFNLLLVLTLFFSAYFLKSILFFADIFLVCLYYVLAYLDRAERPLYINLLLYCVSLFSLVHVINDVFPVFGEEYIFLGNPIFQGIASGMGVVIALYNLLGRTKKIRSRFFLFTGIQLLVNLGGVFVSGSKAAFLGVVAFSIYMTALFILKWKKPALLGILLGILTLFIILVFTIPNPIKDSFYFSLKVDPYASNRIDMWKMALTVFEDNPLAGVGLANFAEVKEKYNFKQEQGPAHYFKAPEKPHNDYFKFLAETGVPGLLLLLVSLFYILRKTLSRPRLDGDASKILILYLLTQAFLFNFIFYTFFFFVFIFLLKGLFEERLTFKSLNPGFRLGFSLFLGFVWVILYLFPYLSGRYIEKSTESDNMATAFVWMKKAEYVNLLDHRIYYFQSLFFHEYFRQSADLESFYYALDNLKKAQRLNRYDKRAFLGESDLYVSLLRQRLKYPSLRDEIIAPLEKAEEIAPFDPFIKLRKARIYLEFGQTGRAEEEARKALALEPEFVSALYFLQRHFNRSPDPGAFREKIEKIRQKRERLNPPPGTYLYDLYRVPESFGP